MRNALLESLHRAWGRNLHIGHFDDPSATLAEATARTARMLVELVEPRAGELVVDLGCGFAETACMVARDFGCRVLACDVRSRRLQAAPPSPERGSVHLFCADHVSLPLPEQVADVVLAIDSLGHSADLFFSVSEVARVLKPGARFVALDVWSSRLIGPRHLATLGFAPQIPGKSRWRGLFDTFEIELLRFEDWSRHGAETWRRLTADLEAMDDADEGAKAAATLMAERLRWLEANAYGHVVVLGRRR